MSLFPVFLKLDGQPVLVVGGGAIALPKIEALVGAGADVEVVAPALNPPVEALVRKARLTWRCERFASNLIARKRVVFAATGVRSVDREVAAACRSASILYNAVDDPDHCSFYMPAIVNRGDLQIAISTNGKSPALAQQLRRKLETQFPADWRERIAELGLKRSDILRTHPAGPERTAILHAAAAAALRTSRLQVTPRIAGALHRAKDAIVGWLNSEEETVALI